MLLITSLYASILALYFIALSFLVILLRTRFNTFIGNGEQKELEKFVRIHGNFAEYIPFALILMAIYEINLGDSLYLHIFGIAFILSRLFHAVGLIKNSNGASIYRLLGVHLVFWPMAILSVLNILNFTNA